MNKLIAPAKKALSAKYGYKNVSVKNGTGTSWGWVKVRIIANKPENCTGDNPTWCSNCRNNINEIYNESRKIMSEAWEKLGLKPYSYCSDDGYNTENDEVLIEVIYI